MWQVGNIQLHSVSQSEARRYIYVILTNNNYRLYRCCILCSCLLFFDIEGSFQQNSTSWVGSQVRQNILNLNKKGRSNNICLFDGLIKNLKGVQANFPIYFQQKENFLIRTLLLSCLPTYLPSPIQKIKLNERICLSKRVCHVQCDQIGHATLQQKEVRNLTW